MDKHIFIFFSAGKYRYDGGGKGTKRPSKDGLFWVNFMSKKSTFLEFPAPLFRDGRN
ncbi:conserved hypothetical protein [delta proteobacterium NaphS2]|nr:conserved hypothetical protein [delta proteobacterium NaphS2]